jgi:hypothetical protein
MAPWLSTSVLLLFALPAFAAPRVAALVPSLKPPGATEVRDKFHEAVASGLSAAGMTVLPPAEVRMRLQSSEEQLQCSGPGPCAQAAATSLHVEHTLATEIVIAGKDYTIRMKLLDASGKELARSEDTCDICTVKEADDAVSKAATKLASANRALLESTVPPTPPPPARPEAPLPSAAPVTKPEAAPAPAPEAAAPVAPAAPAEKVERKPFPWRWVAIGSLAVGVVGLAVGIPLVVIDGRYTDCPAMTTNPMKQCKSIENTLGGGATLTVLGSLGLAASGVLFYFDWRSRHQATTRVSVSPLPGGAFVSVGRRF